MGHRVRLPQKHCAGSSCARCLCGEQHPIFDGSMLAGDALPHRHVPTSGTVCVGSSAWQCSKMVAFIDCLSCSHCADCAELTN
jgi:hypothetical protein